MKKSSIFKLTRRNFVAAGSAFAGILGFSGASRAVLASSNGLSRQQAAGLSIAYLDGSEDWHYLSGLTPTLQMPPDMAVDQARLIAADSLSNGDSTFTDRGARVTVHGMIAEPASHLVPMQLKARYHPYHEETHIAWGYDGAASGSQSGTGFTIPVDANSGLQLSLEMQPDDSKLPAMDPIIAEAQFVPGSTPGKAKLRRGAYLLSWDLFASGPMLSAWEGCQVIAEQIETPEEGMPETRRFMVTGASGKAKALPALLITVEYGEGPAVTV